MNTAKKLESMLEMMCSEVYEIISNNMDEASDYVRDLSSLDDIRELFRLAVKNQGSALSAIINAAAISDVLYFIVQAILADDEVAYDELQASAELVSESLYRYCWLEDYERFEYVSDGDDMRQLLAAWQDDDGWLGGDRSEGAILRPFNDFALLACLVSKSPATYQLYVKCSLLILTLVLEAGGVEKSEQALYDELSESLYNTEASIVKALGSSASAPKPISGRMQDNGLTESDNTIAPDEALKEGLAELNELVGVGSVKAEVLRLMNFLNIRQQRIDQGMAAPKQSLHFVFTGNPGTGKTTVARIIAKIMYGFQILETPNLVEADRAAMVGGYIGQTAIKTQEIIDKAANNPLNNPLHTSCSSAGAGFRRGFRTWAATPITDIQCGRRRMITA